MPSSVNDIAAPAPLANTNGDTAYSEMSSSSPPGSVVGSDASNTAAGSVSSEEETLDAVVVPYTGPVGSNYTQDTLPKDFSDWPIYLSYCEDGPIVHLECIDTVNDDGTPDQFNKMAIPRKLLCDYSHYFKAMFRHEFNETTKGTVRFVDILQEEMMRLKLFLMSGTPDARVSIGKPEEEMSNLVRTYELADRFDMPEVTEWIRVRTVRFVVSHCNWRVAYQHEVTDAPAVSTITTAKEDFHRAKLLDFCKAYSMLVKLPSQARLVRPDQLLTLIAESCPPVLLRSMMRYIDQDLVVAIFATVLDNMSVGAGNRRT